MPAAEAQSRYVIRGWSGALKRELFWTGEGWSVDRAEAALLAPRRVNLVWKSLKDSHLPHGLSHVEIQW
jgi:hypothetical protein